MSPFVLSLTDLKVTIQQVENEKKKLTAQNCSEIKLFDVQQTLGSH